MECFDLLYLCKSELRHQAPYLVKFNGIFPLQIKYDLKIGLSYVNIIIWRSLLISQNIFSMSMIELRGRVAKSIDILSFQENYKVNSYFE